MRILRVAAPLLLALVAAARPSGAEEEARNPEHEVEALVEKIGVKADTPGIAVLVTDAHGVRMKKAWGLANLASHAPITTSTTFELASVSKQVTGSAVLLLIQRGKLALGDDVRKHLPELPVYDAEHPITVDHLSRHTSGLPDYLSWEGPEPSKGYLTNADILAEFAKRKESSPLEFTPGERYDYSNSGYMLLACLVERLSGQSFGAFLGKEFFEPLGMKSAWVHEGPAVPAATTAVGYTPEDDGWKATWAAPTKEKHEKLFATGDGSVWASRDDMAAWDGGLRAGKPVKPETLMGALKPGRTSSGERVAYAMGWNVEYGDHEAVTSVYHSGKWGGFENFILHDAGRDLTVVVLCNRGGFEAGDFAYAVAALFHE